jgi:hypothetical protein
MHNNIYALQNQNVLQFGAEGVMLCRMTSILTGLHNIKKNGNGGFETFASVQFRACLNGQ